MFQYDYKVKFCLLGSSGAGKSSLAQRLVAKEKINVSNVSHTIGLDFLTTYFIHKNKEIKIDIWDTAGQERFLTITRTYYRHGDIYIIVLDTNNFSIEKDIEFWLEEIKNNNPDMSKPIFIIGNKIDLLNNQKKEKEIKNRIEEHYPFNPVIFISVVDNKNIDYLMESIFETLKLEENRREFSSINLMEHPVSPNNRKCC
jgi:small GTP-binding protein